MIRKHNANLDLLRTVAITIVFFFHLSQYVAGLPPFFHNVAALGSYGVDLFFVLSGWLIGGIFFREYASTGQVRLGHFWARRWFRTMPPYYGALALSWLVVYYTRHEPFDIRYLFFLQNYSSALPFFKISWSLCVEEHFYLFLPLFAYLFTRQNMLPFACVALISCSLFMRWQLSGTEASAFGYRLTATHLRLDGLALGILCAYIYTIKPASWQWFSATLIRMGMVGGVATMLIHFIYNDYMHSIGIFALSLFFAALLCLSINNSDWWVSRARFVTSVAVSSYSIYLVHALAINIAFRFFPAGQLIFAASALLATAIMTLIFHLCIEQVSKRVRDNLFPNRANAIIPR